jgi:hypothetical protein
MSKKLTIDEIINKIIDNDYDFSQSNYVSLDKKIIVIDIDGFEHLIRPDSLLVGNKLNIKSVINKENYLIKKFNKIHKNLFDYSKFTYINSDTKIDIICQTHGIFKQTINNHLRGKGCPKCNGKNKSNNDIINEFKSTHGNKYNYSKVTYSGIKNKVIIICPKHGEFKQSPEEHIKGCGCPICKESNGERKIRLFLESNNVSYIPQHKFNDCKNILSLPFDFYLPDYNTCIEYQGEQHYRPIEYFGGIKQFNKQIINDKIKMEYCQNNNIPLIMIKYGENIFETLKKFSNI